MIRNNVSHFLLYIFQATHLAHTWMDPSVQLNVPLVDVDKVSFICETSFYKDGIFFNVYNINILLGKL